MAVDSVAAQNASTLDTSRDRIWVHLMRVVVASDA